MWLSERLMKASWASRPGQGDRAYRAGGSPASLGAGGGAALATGLPAAVGPGTQAQPGHVGCDGLRRLEA